MPIKTAIVTPRLSPDLHPCAALTRHLAGLLAVYGEDVTIIHTGPPQADSLNTAGLLIPVVKIANEMPVHLAPGALPHVLLSELVSQHLHHGFDVVYFIEQGGAGLVPLRARRYQTAPGPVMAGVLCSPSAFERRAALRWDQHFDELALDFAEAYTAAHVDALISVGSFPLTWAQEAGWSLPSDVHTLRAPLLTAQPAANADQLQPLRRLLYLGELSTAGGFEIFVRGVRQAARRLPTLNSITLLGPAGTVQYPSLTYALDELRGDTGVTVTHIDPASEAEYLVVLHAHTGDGLAVFTPRMTTVSYLLLLALQVPGLRLLCADAPGVRDHLIDDDASMTFFEPHPPRLADALVRAFDTQPSSVSPAFYGADRANQGWLDVHAQLSTRASGDRAARTRPPRATVDVIMPYHNLGQYLPAALKSLDEQTVDTFHLYVIDDGSTDPQSQEIFAQMQAQYAHRANWHFVSQENKGVCETRNAGAAMGESPFILFMDPDNLATPHMIERFVDAIQISGDDCLTSYMTVFSGEHPTDGGFSFPGTYVHRPVGNAPVLNLLENPYGDNHCIFRRTAFEAVGGYTTDYPDYVNHEDVELFTRLALSGFRLDVIPESLFYYRYRPDSRLRSTHPYLNEARVMRVYEDILKSHGLQGIIPLLLGLKYRNQVSIQALNVDMIIEFIPWHMLIMGLWGKLKRRFARLLYRLRRRWSR